MSGGWQPLAPYGDADRGRIPPWRRRRLPKRPIIDVTRSTDSKPRYAFQPLDGMPYIPNACDGSCRSGAAGVLSLISILWVVGIDQAHCRECPLRPNTANAWPRTALPPRKP